MCIFEQGSKGDGVRPRLCTARPTAHRYFSSVFPQAATFPTSLAIRATPSHRASGR